MRSLPVALAWMLIACQSAATPGAMCTRNADCAAPLTCRHGRCRTECAEARDCPTGLRCLLDASGLGSCSLPPENTCAMDTQCGSDLVCGGTQCRTTCSADTQCGSGGTCTNGSCIVPVSGAADAGVIDAGTRPTSGTGMPCVPVDGGSGCPMGYDCTVSAELTSMPVCRKPCATDADCITEGQGSFCYMRGMPHCTTPCDPVTNAGCGTEVCGLYSGNPPSPEPMVQYVDCRPAGPIGLDRGTCTHETDCAVGLNCETTVCRRSCNYRTGMPNVCEPGFSCYPQGPLVNDIASALWGACCPDPSGC